MRRNWKNNRSLYIIIVLVILSACGKNGEHAEHPDIYTCPMHPTVVSDKPGICPVCGMDLVRKARAGEEVEITEDIAKLLKSPNEIVISNIKTIKGKFKTMPMAIQAQGVVTYDTRNIYTIPARIGGRLEKVYLKYPFQKVSKGQKVAEIYSPELIEAQRELLFILENDADNTTLIEGSKNKLALLGVSQSQINQLTNRKETQNTFSIYSPYNGYIITSNQKAPEAPAVSASSQSEGNGMGSGMAGSTTGSSVNTMPTNGNEASLIREGSYVSSGEILFKIVNTAQLRIALNISSSQAGSIKKGSEVQLDLGDGRMQKATVDFIQPFFNEGEEFVTVRVYTKGIENLQIGQLINAVIKGDSTEGLWVPKEAVLDLGLEKIIFIKDRNVLKPKKVVIGTRTGALVEIKQGLSSSDEIAANAQYLIDSESFIKTRQ